MDRVCTDIRRCHICLMHCSDLSLPRKQVHQLCPELRWFCS